MSQNMITAAGIDVSKAKSRAAVRRPGGGIVLMPFQADHTVEDIQALVKTLNSTGGNIGAVMEHTGMYWRPIACALKKAGFFVSVVNTTLDSPYRTKTGHHKWGDFAKRFWHRDCVAKLSLRAFSEADQKWCRREGYRFHEAAAEKINRSAQSAAAAFPCNESTKLLITQAIALWIKNGQRVNIFTSAWQLARLSFSESIYARVCEYLTSSSESDPVAA